VAQIVHEPQFSKSGQQMKQLSSQAIDLIRSSGLLYGQVAECVGVAPESLRRILAENRDHRLVSAEVVALIEQHKLKVAQELQDTPIISEMQAVA